MHIIIIVNFVGVDVNVATVKMLLLSVYVDPHLEDTSIMQILLRVS